MSKFDYVVALIAIVTVFAIAVVAGCRWDGATIKADVPIYGNGEVIIEPVVIDIPDDTN